MTSLPVVRRELLVAARQRMTYLSRTLTAGILLPVFALLYNLHIAGTAFAGAHILNVLSTLLFIESMLAGVRYTSDCISEERREGTLGLLFLTDLGGMDIVLGKLFARGLRAFYSLFAALPILALTIFLGGVTGRQVFAVSITLVVCIFFSLAAGAFISSRGYRERNVLAGVLLFLVGITIVPMAVNAVAIHVFGFYGFIDTLVYFSPYYAFTEAGRGFTKALSPALWTLLLTSVMFIVYAAWRTRRTFGEMDLVKASEPVVGSRRKKRRSVIREPLNWLAGQGRIRQVRVIWLALFILCFGVFANTAVSNNWNWAIPVVFLGTYGLHAFYKFLLTAETIRQVNEDRRSGALELLLVTPAEPGDIVRAQIQATVRKWLPVMLALGWCNYMWMGARTFDREEVIQAILPISVLLLVSDTIVLPYRGLLRALHGERYTLTVFKTFFRTQGPPLGLIAFMLGMAIGSTTQSAARNCFVAWGIICVVYNVVLVVDARVRLRKHFRKLAAGESIPAVWGRRVLPILSARQTYPAVGRTA